MRIDSMYAVTHGTDAVCPQCGKVYYKTEEWAYKCSLGKSCFRIFCSWSCMRAARAAYERKAEEARMERVEKRKGLPRYVCCPSGSSWLLFRPQESHYVL